MIHFDKTLAQTNGFLFWWLWINANNEDSFDGSLISVVNNTKVITSKRLYVLGQFSRFIRPGWVRIHSDTNPWYRIYTSAYKNPASKEIAIVLINDSSADALITLNLNDADFASLEIYRTSDSENLQKIGNLSLESNTPDIHLPVKSVTTLVGLVR